MLRPATVLLLIACSKKAPEPEVASAPEPAPVETEEPAPPPSPVEQVTRNFERVFFALDSATLAPAAIDALEDNAELLMEHPGTKVRIQGHADERGTTEYNLALGDKRANAIRDALTNLGVDGSQLETVSYGEERPLSDEDGVLAWAKDRRAEFRVLADPAGAVEGTVGQPVDSSKLVPEDG